MELPRPGDFFIGVKDFFAILMPGMIGAGLVAWQLNLAPQKNEAGIYWIVLFMAGYVLGHLLHAVSSLLDPLLFDPFFEPDKDLTKCYLMKHKRPARWKIHKRMAFAVREYSHRNHQLFAYARDRVNRSTAYLDGMPKKVFALKDLIASDYDDKKSEALPARIFQWVRIWLRVHSAEATAELDRLEADSKLFRSLGLILPIFVATRWRWLESQGPATLFLSTGAIILSLWRYCDLRQKTIRACYLHFVQLDSELKLTTPVPTRDSDLRNKVGIESLSRGHNA